MGAAHPFTNTQANMKLMIGIPTGEYSRRPEFYDYFLAMDKPENSIIMFTHGQSPAKGRNQIIEKAFETDCSHIIFIDDDMILQKDSLTRILKHWNYDIVSGLYLLRNYPHYPAAFDESYDDGQCKFMFLTPDKNGLTEVVNCGFGFLLIRTNVFNFIEKPWIRLGEIEKDSWCDDIGFFNRVRKAGFRIYCDLDIKLGHMINLTLWPEKNGNGWTSNYVTNTGQKFEFPQVLSVADAMVERLEK